MSESVLLVFPPDRTKKNTPTVQGEQGCNDADPSEAWLDPDGDEPRPAELGKLT